MTSADAQPALSLRGRVEAARPGDAHRGVMRLSRRLMAELGLRPGDVCEVAGERRTHVRLLPDAGDGGEPVALPLDAEQRRNAGVVVGQQAVLRPLRDPAAATEVRLRSVGASPSTDALVRMLVDRPLTEGDGLQPTIDGRRGADLLVTAIEPGPVALVRRETRVVVEADATARDAVPGVGGLAAQIARLQEMIALPLRRPDLFRALGLEPPRGVLFIGPPGTGKTLLARRLAETAGASFHRIDGPEVVSKHYGDSEARLREVFETAASRAPAILFIDEIDAIAPKRDALSGERQLERRIVAQLLTLMDGLDDRGEVVVIAATNQPEAIDPALRRPGRFDRELAFGAPDAIGRREILEVHLAEAPRAPDLDLDAVAADCRGFVGADLAALAREAAVAAITRAADAAGGVERVDAVALALGAADFAAARRLVGPSVLRGAALEPPDARWEDVGGHEAAKRLLTEAVLRPLSHPDLMRRLGLAPPAGVLLAGPPGGGKTLLARALAGESGVNFLPVSAPQLLSRHFGDAERSVAEVFARARHAAPAILFLDELDALAPRRGAADAALDRVVAQLLVEIDGIDRRPGVFVLGATNRPEAIDPALTRPGRFDLVVPVGAPDATARHDILAVQTRGMPLGRDVSLAALADRTEGWSGAELRALAQGAARFAMRRILDEGEGAGSERIQPRDFDEAWAERRASDAARAGAAKGERT